MARRDEPIGPPPQAGDTEGRPAPIIVWLDYLFRRHVQKIEGGRA
jgi:hypothetical protein